MATLRARLDELGHLRDALGDVRSMSTAELERLVVQRYGYLPDDAELQRLVDQERHDGDA